jgi:hypothetical protein
MLYRVWLLASDKNSEYTYNLIIVQSCGPNSMLSTIDSCSPRIRSFLMLRDSLHSLIEYEIRVKYT